MSANAKAKENLKPVEYWAFISYSRVPDAGLARALQQKLEAIRLPAAFRNQSPGGSANLRPVCLDQTEFGAAAGLPEQIQDHLRRSRWLILVGSPAAARSPWVNREVEFFRSLPQGENILLVVAGGDPFTEGDCFPPALPTGLEGPMGNWMDLRPGALDANTAVKRLAAGMLGVSMDQFVRRHRTAERKRLITILAAGGALTVLASLTYWDFKVRPQVAFFSGIDVIHGLPEGKHPLSAQDIRSRESSYKILRKGRWGPVTALETVDSTGNPYPDEAASAFDYRDSSRAAAWFNQECRWTYEQLAGKLKTERAFNRSGSLLFKVDYEYPGEGDGAVVTGWMETAAGERPVLPSGAASKVIHLDEAGRNAVVYYRSRTGEPLKDGLGWGREYEYDPAEGTVLKSWVLDATQSKQESSRNVARIDYVRGPRGLLQAMSYHDGQGRPVTNHQGIHRITYTHSPAGNQTGERYFGISGKPLAVEGAAGFDITLTESGFTDTFVYVGEDGLPVPHPGAGGSCGIRYEFDRTRDRGSVQFLDRQLQPVEIAAGIAGFRFLFTIERGTRGELLGSEEIEFRNPQGQPCFMNGRPYAIEKRKYGSSGLLMERRFFGLLGEPVEREATSMPVGAEGGPARRYHRIVMHYNALWQETRREYFPADPLQPGWVEERKDEGG